MPNNHIFVDLRVRNSFKATRILVWKLLACHTGTRASMSFPCNHLNHKIHFILFNSCLFIQTIKLTLYVQKGTKSENVFYYVSTNWSMCWSIYITKINNCQQLEHCCSSNASGMPVSQTGRFGPKPNRPQWKNGHLDVSALFCKTFRPYYSILLDWLVYNN
jgi:hypothetical protein